MRDPMMGPGDDMLTPGVNAVIFYSSVVCLAEAPILAVAALTGCPS